MAPQNENTLPLHPPMNKPRQAASGEVLDRKACIHPRLHRHKVSVPMFAMLVCNDNGSLELYHTLAWHVDAASNTQVSLWRYLGSNIVSLSLGFVLQASSLGFWEPKSRLQQAAIQLDMQNHSVTLTLLLLAIISIITTTHAISIPTTQPQSMLPSDATFPTHSTLPVPPSLLTRRSSMPSADTHHQWEASWVELATWLLLTFNIFSAIYFIGMWEILQDVVGSPQT